jgi:chemotaxis protein MotA
MKSSSHSIPGIVFCCLLLIGATLIGDGRLLMFNLVGFVVVLTGTLGATFISYTKKEIIVAMKVARNTYRSNIPSEQEIVSSLLDLSLKAKLDGLLALERDADQVSVLFLKRALSMLVDGFNADDIKDALYTEIHFFQQRRALHERLFRHMALLAPAFGVAGGVIGLIGMLDGIGDTGVILKTIPIALTSTLYGIVMAYFICIPLAENIHGRTQDELLILKLIAEGVMLIEQEYNTVRLQTRLEAFITPRQRHIQYKSFQEIRERYQQIKKAKLDAELAFTAL